jgi:hypothetical protein
MTFPVTNATSQSFQLSRRTSIEASPATTPIGFNELGLIKGSKKTFAQEQTEGLGPCFYETPYTVLS